MAEANATDTAASGRKHQHYDTMMNRIQSRDLTVAVIGLGYVGLPLVTTFHDAGFNVLAYDLDQSKIDSIQQGKSYILHSK